MVKGLSHDRVQQHFVEQILLLVLKALSWGQSSTASEDADSGVEDELEEVRHDDWVSVVDEHRRVFFWNQRHNTTHWSMPPGTLPPGGCV